MPRDTASSSELYPGADGGSFVQVMTSPWCRAIMPPRRRVHVAMPSCHHVAMPSCRHAVMPCDVLSPNSTVFGVLWPRSSVLWGSSVLPYNQVV